jgi:hypothetical protein
MYTITWKEGRSQRLYEVRADHDNPLLPAPRFAISEDLGPVFEYAVFMYRMCPGDFERPSDNSFVLTGKQYKGFKRDIEKRRSSSVIETYPNGGSY